jgi:DNA polymerase IV (DinB-like DNA polymerase)
VQRLTGRFGRNIGLWMWKVANGSQDEPVHPREDSVSLSIEQKILWEFTKDRILVYANELVDELYGRLVRRGYMFRTVGVKLVRTVFSVKTREVSFPGLQARPESISSVIEQLLDRFSFCDSAPAVRKMGLRMRNLVSAHEEEGQIRPQKSILDYLKLTIAYSCRPFPASCRSDLLLSHQYLAYPCQTCRRHHLCLKASRSDYHS